MASAAAVASEPSELLFYAVGKDTIAIELVNNGDVTALQAEIALPGGPVAKGATATCTASLPKTHQGTCNFSNGVFKLVVMSPSLKSLRSGPIGSLRLSGDVSTIKNVEVRQLLMGDASKQVPARALVDVGNAILSEDFTK